MSVRYGEGVHAFIGALNGFHIVPAVHSSTKS